MRLVTVCSFMFLNSCAILAFGLPTYTTENGIKVYNRTETDIDITQEEVENYVDTVLTHMGYTTNSADGMVVEFFDKLIQMGKLDEDHPTAQFSDGVAYRRHGRVIISVFTKCLAASGLGHEMMHILKGNYHSNEEFVTKLEQLEVELQSSCSTEDLLIEAEKRKTP